MSMDEIEARSIRAVRNHVRHVKEVSPHYQNTLFDIFAEDIKTIDSIKLLPFTERRELIDDTPMFLGVLPEQIIETVLTSGSQNRPLVFELTGADIDRLAYNEALSFHATGVTAKDSAQILLPIDKLAISGMAYYRGLTGLGANTARIGVLPADQHKHFIELLKPTVLIGLPSHLLKLAKDLAKQGYDTRTATVRKIICTGESLRDQDMELNSVGKAIEDHYNAKVFSSYMSTEVSTSYCECMTQYGGHAHPELVYTEIVDDVGNQVLDGAVGELVVTPLGVEGMPLVRYRTGDLTFRVQGTCACGRNSLRIGPILGRKSQLIKVKGTSVYPLTITTVMDSLDGIEDYIIVLEDDDAQSDRATIHVATQPSNLDSIGTQLRARIHVHMPVLVSNLATIRHFRGTSTKRTRFADKRKNRK